MQVRVGGVELNDDKYGITQRIRIAGIIPHPEYKFSFNYRDIAIVRLAEPVAVTSFVAPICLRPRPVVKGEFTVMGYGATSLDNDGSTNLIKSAKLR